MINNGRITLNGIMYSLVQDQGCIAGKLRQIDRITKEYIYLAIAVLIIYFASSCRMNNQVQLVDTITSARRDQGIVINTRFVIILASELIHIAYTDSILRDEAIAWVDLQMLDVNRIKAIDCLERVVIYTRLEERLTIEVKSFARTDGIIRHLQEGDIRTIYGVTTQCSSQTIVVEARIIDSISSKDK